MDKSLNASGPVTREKLIEAAGEIFAEKGLHGARGAVVRPSTGASKRKSTRNPG